MRASSARLRETNDLSIETQMLEDVDLLPQRSLYTYHH